jgi:hypothetical protein
VAPIIKKAEKSQNMPSQGEELGKPEVKLRPTLRPEK